MSTIDQLTKLKADIFDILSTESYLAQQKQEKMKTLGELNAKLAEEKKAAAKRADSE